MRCYFKRLVLVVIVILSIAGTVLFQTIYYIPTDVAKEAFRFEVLAQRKKANDSRSIETISVENAQRKTYKVLPKPLSHEELRWPYENEEQQISDSIRKDLSEYLTKRKSNPKILALNKIPLEKISESGACRNTTILGTFYKKKFRKVWPRNNTWDHFYYQMGFCDLYREKTKVVDDLLKDISTMPIKNVTNLQTGTQVKFLITYKNGRKAIFKPMRFSRQYETHPDHFYFTDFERHHAEIAAFHLDRLLGFRRAIPTVGRVVNISKDFWPVVDKPLEKTFFYSPAKNVCFVGKCDYYCDTTHAICGHPDLVEGSFQVFLPDRKLVQMHSLKSPFKRTYNKKVQKAQWQVDNSFCSKTVKFNPSFKKGRRLLDTVDVHILDYLTGNQDRHHLESFAVFQEQSYFLHFDNGRAFGKSNYDDSDILAPLTQCCLIRPSTLKTLLTFFFGPVSLSEALNESMKADPLFPILADKHFPAIERRLEFVLESVFECIEKAANGDYRKVVMNEYNNEEAIALGADVADKDYEEQEEEDDPKVRRD